jgi:hypothetical protein
VIAAIYARKSTEQAGAADEEKSVTRQLEHATAYAARKGWAVGPAHVYVDDGSPAPAVGRGAVPAIGDAMTVREQETLLRALDLWRTAVGQMSWEARAEAALALLIVRDDELEELRRRIQRGEIQ